MKASVCYTETADSFPSFLENKNAFGVVKLSPGISDFAPRTKEVDVQQNPNDSLMIYTKGRNSVGAAPCNRVSCLSLSRSGGMVGYSKSNWSNVH